MRKLYFILISLFCFQVSISVIAQDTTKQAINIKVVNPKNDPVPFASITVIDRTDSSGVIKKIADKNGLATFDLQTGGQYVVEITAVDFSSLNKGIVISANSRDFSFQMEPAGRTLETAVITAKKPLMRQEDDKLIVDPENLVASSTSGYEVLEKTPGLFIDQDGNIYISSFRPAQVQINGRDMRMSASDIASLLKSLPPDAVSKIEIVRTPSAKYDASGSGGVVNVVLKKGVKLGLTGSVTSGMQQGTYGNQFAGFSLNNNNGKKSTSLNFNYSRRDNYEKLFTDRAFAPDSILKETAFTRYPTDVLFGNFSYFFPAGKKWEIDFSTSTSLNIFNNSTNNLSAVSVISTGETIESLNLVKNTGTSLNFRSGISGKLLIDSTGSEWVNDIFFNSTINRPEQEYQIFAGNPAQEISAGDGTSGNDRNHLNLQSDLKLKMKKRFTFETGARASILRYKSSARYYKEQNGTRGIDSRRTNFFDYDENINALYVQGSKTFWKDFVIKTGVRMENTNMRGHQEIPYDTTFNIHRTDFFPYVYISKALMKIAGYDLRAYLVYRRTINRPVYEQLNPFPRYINQFLSEAGNPTLRPQFNDNYEANISVDERPILAVGINETKDIFTNVVYQPDSSKVNAIRTYDNLGTNKEWYLRGMGAIPPGGKYFIVVVAQYNHNFYEGLYENKPLSWKKGTWTFFTYQTLKLGRQSQATLHGFLRLKGQQQFYELGSFGSLNASINRRFLKDKLTITASINDIFATNKYDFTLQQGSVNAKGTRYADTRRVGINLRYNFGIRKKEENNNNFPAEPVTN